MTAGSASKLNKKLRFPLCLVNVTLQSPGVASKPWPLIVPLPARSRKLWLREMTAQEVRSKVKPPTLHGPENGDEDAKTHGVDIATALPGAAKAAKSPVSLPTRALFHLFTWEAVTKEPVLNFTPPPKSISPVIGMAKAFDCRKKTRQGTKTDRLDLNCFFRVADPTLRVEWLPDIFCENGFSKFTAK